jgi:hypothetical protein
VSLKPHPDYTIVYGYPIVSHESWPHWWSGLCWRDEEHARQATVLLLGPPGWPA